MEHVKIGIIGAGYIGGVHAGVLARDERVRITAVHDVDETRAQQLARTSGATVSRNAAELIEGVDAVYITTPNTKHVELAIAAASIGKHVFCEKPMATKLEAAHSVLRATESSRAIFQVGHNRFAPVYVLLKRLLAEGSAPHSAHAKMNRG